MDYDDGTDDGTNGRTEDGRRRRTDVDGDRGRTTTTGRTTRRTDGQRTDDIDGRTWTDGQRTDDDDGTDDGTDGRTEEEEEEEEDDDDGTRRDTTGHDGTRWEGRRGYPIFSKKYIDGLPLEIDTHRHFWTSKKISEPVRIFL